ncbi:unnamed protein product [Orchesella dallaii]|uniref:Uncharacterized protein n=1 Tax=Orchesella dallaii TaxID=48710 RepID=A0ABP1PWZ2_9HEXA
MLGKFRLAKFKHPLRDEDPVHASLEAGIGLIFMWTISIFIYNLSYPLFPSFLSSYFQASSSSIIVRLIFSVVEAYIMCFTWTTNIVMIVIMLLTTYSPTFWVAQMGIGSKVFENFNRFSMMYRELQLLVVQHNECFAGPTSNLLFIAFTNQSATNFGALKLYGKISNGAWATCFYMMLTGMRTLFHLHTMLAAAFLTSDEIKEEWKKILPEEKFRNHSSREKKWFRKFERACPSLKVYQGSYRYFQRDSGIEFVDSVIDKTVSLLMY